jgi:hypothetical protein
MIEPTGNRIYADDLDITDDFADGFVNALRIETPDNTRIAAESAERSGRPDHLQQWRLYRLRSLRGRPGAGAAVAGQGQTGHPERRNQDNPT